MSEARQAVTPGETRDHFCSTSLLPSSSHSASPRVVAPCRSPDKPGPPTTTARKLAFVDAKHRPVKLDAFSS